MSLGSDAKMRLSIEELVLYNFILPSAHVYIVSSGVHEHLKEAWSDRGHFCGSPPQEHVTGGMQSPEAQDTRPSLLSSQAVLSWSRHSTLDEFATAILVQGGHHSQGPEALGRSSEGYSSGLDIQGIQQAPCLEDEPAPVGS